MTPAQRLILLNRDASVLSLSFAAGIPAVLEASGGVNAHAFSAANLITAAQAPRQDFGNAFAPGAAPRMNYLTQSNTFSASAWSKLGSGVAAPLVSASAVLSPDGTADASQVVFAATTASNQTSKLQQLATVNVGGLHQVSVWVRGTVGGETLYVEAQRGGPTYEVLGFALIVATTAWVQYSFPVTAVTDGVYISIGTDTTAGLPVAQAGGTVLLYQAQLEPGPLVTASIVTGATPVIVTTSGLLVEAGATNLCLQSDGFAAAPWSVSVTSGKSVTLTAAAGTGPDGAASATRAVISATTTTGQSANVQQLISGLTPGALYTASVWVKGATGAEALYLGIQNGATPYTAVAAQLISPTTGWGRYSVPFTPAGATVYLTVGSNTQTGSAQLPAAGGTVYLYNAQLEQGAMPSSDVISGASAATRSADLVQFTLPAPANAVVYTFAHGGQQTVMTAPGVNTIPTNLNRAKIVAMAGVDLPSRPITSVVCGAPLRYNTPTHPVYVDSDTWSPAWAANDALIVSHDDAYAYGGVGPRSNLAISQLSTWQLGVYARSVNLMAPWGALGQTGSDNATWKAFGLISIAGVLYSWVSRNVYGVSSDNWVQTTFGGQLIKSPDLGATWTPAPPATAAPYASPMFPSGDFSSCYWVQYPVRDYARPDGPDLSNLYVYAVSAAAVWNNGSAMYIGRCLITAVGNQNASDWSFYQGGDGTASVNWGALASAVSIVSSPLKTSVASVLYLPFCRRYLMMQWYSTAIAAGSTTSAGASGDTWWIPYESPTPWGPWTPLAGTRWNAATPTPGRGLYNPNIPPQAATIDGGRSLVALTAGDYNNQSTTNGDYCLTQVPLTVGTG